MFFLFLKMHPSLSELFNFEKTSNNDLTGLYVIVLIDIREASKKKKTRKVEIFFRKKGREVRHKLNNFNFLGLLFFEGFPKQGDRD